MCGHFNFQKMRYDLIMTIRIYESFYAAKLFCDMWTNNLFSKFWSEQNVMYFIFHDCVMLRYVIYIQPQLLLATQYLSKNPVFENWWLMQYCVSHMPSLLSLREDCRWQELGTEDSDGGSWDTIPKHRMTTHWQWSISNQWINQSIMMLRYVFMFMWSSLHSIKSVSDSHTY